MESERVPAPLVLEREALASRWAHKLAGTARTGPWAAQQHVLDPSMSGLCYSVLLQADTAAHT